MTVQATLMTVDEFWALYGDKRYELIRGEVTEVMTPVYVHGSIANRVGRYLGNFVDQHQLGDVVTEAGFVLAENTLRLPDVAFISRAKQSTITEPEKFLPFAPDLAVEVVSPNDRATEIQDKVTLYLEAGTALVWIIYPDLQQVVVHQVDHTSKTVSQGETLDGGDVLPGLAIAVSDLFPPVANQE